MVGPSTRKRPSTNTLNQILSSRIFTPRPTPEMADRVAIRLMPPMSQSWFVL